MASPRAKDDLYVRRPDNIKPADKHKYPHLGGIFHDNIPAGKEAISMHGYTDDATPPVEEVSDADRSHLSEGSSDGNGSNAVVPDVQVPEASYRVRKGQK